MSAGREFSSRGKWKFWFKLYYHIKIIASYKNLYLFKVRFPFKVTISIILIQTLEKCKTKAKNFLMKKIHLIYGYSMKNNISKQNKKNYYMKVFLTLICYETKNIRWFFRRFEGFETFIDAMLRNRTQID